MLCRKYYNVVKILRLNRVVFEIRVYMNELFVRVFAIYRLFRIEEIV